MSGMFEGKTALVTGAGSGIGRSSAIAFAREGARVMVSDIDEAAAAETAHMIGAQCGEALFRRCDVAEPDAIAALVRSVVDRWGGLDLAHNNAGISPRPASLVKTSTETWGRVIGVNLTSIFYALQAQIPAMLARGGGAIVNTASTAGMVGAPGLAAYSASKHGVIGLTKSAALEVATRGIRINALCPGAVGTAMFNATFPGDEAQQAVAASAPMGRVAHPDEMAGMVIWLCSPAASYVTAGAFPVDGGMTAI